MKTWYKIECSADNATPADVYLYDDIGGWGVSARDFLAAVKAIPGERAINLHIHSGGGSVFEGFAIYTALRDMGARITAFVDGIAASIASVIAVAADRIVIAEAGYMMIHEPACDGYQTAEEMRKTSDLLDKLGDSIAETYARRTGKDSDYWREKMQAESWFTAAEALAEGLVTEVRAYPAMAAALNLHSEKIPAGALELLRDGGLEAAIEAAHETETETDSTADTTEKSVEVAPESTDTEPAPEGPAAATEIDPDGERKAREDEIYDEGVAAGRAESLEPLRAEHAAELAAIQAAHANEITEAKREIDALRRAIDGKQAETGRAVQALADARKKLEAFGAGFRLDPAGATETSPGDFWGAVARIEAAGSEHDEAIIEARKKYPELHAAMVRSANRQ